MESKTPVLLIIFNRPILAQTVLEQIKRYKPSRFYVAADGPRESVQGEKELCQQTRDVVLSGIDWDCEVKTLFREQNLGCGPNVSQSISWFFSHEEMGVILEDDILVNEGFFEFSSQMLEKYRHDNRIMMVSGYNFSGSNIISNRYFFTRNPSVSGWASWRRAWNLFDFELTQWPKINNKKTMKNLFPDIIERYRKTKQLSKLFKSKKVDIWDQQWAFALIINDGKVIVPEANLCRHLGFDSGTHYSQQPGNMTNFAGNIDFGEIVFPLKHPDNILRNIAFERKYVMNRLKGKIKRVFNFSR